MQIKDIEVPTIGVESLQNSDVMLPNLLNQARGRGSLFSNSSNTALARKSIALQQQVQLRSVPLAMNRKSGVIEKVNLMSGGDDESASKALIQNPIELQMVMAFLKTKVNVQNAFGEKIQESVFVMLACLWALIVGIANLSGVISVVDNAVISNSLGLSESMPQSLNFTTDVIQVVLNICLLSALAKMCKDGEVTSRVCAGVLLMCLTGILAGMLNFAVRAIYVGTDRLTLGQAISQQFLQGDATPLTITNMTKLLSGISIVAYVLSHVIDMVEQRTVNKTLIALQHSLVILKEKIGAKEALKEVVHSTIPTILECDKIGMKQELLTIIDGYDRDVDFENLPGETLDIIVDHIESLIGFEKKKGFNTVLAGLVGMALLAGILNTNGFNATSVSAVVGGLHLASAGPRWIRFIKHAIESHGDNGPH